jgi:hypothetical protein
MANKPTNDGRKSDGKFAPGNRLGGSKVGSRHRVTRAIEQMLEGQHEQLTQTAINKALEGDMVALRLCLDRLAPPRKDSPVSISLPSVRTAAEAVEASAAILAALTVGDVTPDEAGRVMALLTAHKGLIETCDLEQRLAALEAKAENER